MQPSLLQQTLQDTLAAVRRRAVLVGFGCGVGRGLLAAGVVVLAAMWVDMLLDLGPAMRIALLLAAGCGAVGLVLWSVRAASAEARPLNLARRMDDLATTRGQIAAGADLMLHPPAGPALTVDLARLAVDRARALAASVSTAAAAPFAPAARAAVAAGAFALAVGLFCILSPRLAANQWLRFTDPWGDHPPYSRISLDVDPGNLKLIYGGSADVRAAATGGPVERADLVLRTNGAGAEEILPMFLEPGGKWRATLSHVTAAGDYYVRAGGARSPRYKIAVITVPRLENVRFRITPPAYTHRPPYDGPLPPGGISGLPLTVVEVRATSNRPLSTGQIRFDFGKTAGAALATTAPMQPAASGASEVAGSFAIRAAGKMSVTVTDTAGQSSTESFTAPITVLPDERPFVRILEPRPNALATPDVDVPVSIAAEDDYGISRLQLFRSLNDSRALPMDLPVGRPEPTRLAASATLRLSSYGLSPGDLIKLYARVEDNDPAGPKGSESGVVLIQIISQEDFQRMLVARQGLETLESKYLQAARRMEALGAELEKLQEELQKAGDGPLADELKKKIEKLAAEMAAAGEEIAKAAEMDLPFDVDQALKDQLKDLAKSLAEAAAQTRAAAGVPAAQAREALAGVRTRLAEKRQQFQDDVIEPLEYLAKIYPLMEDAARFVELYERQKDLAERLASLKGKDDVDDPQLKARMRDLEAEQRQIREALGQLLDDIENHANQLPDDDEKLKKLKTAALTIARQVRASGASDAIAAAEAGLAEFSGTRGYENAQRAADILKQFISEDEGIEGLCMECLGFNPRLAKMLGNTVAQLLACRGLGRGNGAGLGAGGGYSAQSNGMDNTSLYGRVPMMGGPPRSSRGGDRRDGAGSGAGGTVGDDSAQGAAAAARSAAGQPNAAGAAAIPVPPQYQRRVGEYFRRVAEELDQSQKN